MFLPKMALVEPRMLADCGRERTLIIAVDHYASAT
jgi:hypothetical protein